MIKKLILKNWKTHENTELDFSLGTNVMIGKIGSGKTSVVEAICYALYGKIQRTQTATPSNKTYIRENADSAIIQLTFIHDGKEYRIERTLRMHRNNKTTADAYLYEEGVRIETGATKVTRAIEKMLKVDFNLFMRAIYSEQNGIDYLLKLNPGKRKEEMDRLLGLDRFEKARKNLGGIITLIDKELIVTRARVDESEMRRLSKEIKLLSDNLAGLKKNAMVLEKKKRALEKLLKEVDARRNTLKKTKKLYDSIKTELLKTNERIRMLNDMLKDWNMFTETDRKDLSAIEKEIFEFDNNRKHFEKQLRETVERIEKLKVLKDSYERNAMTKKELKERLDKLLDGKSIEDIGKRIESLRARNSEINRTVALLSAEASEIEDSMNKLNALKDKAICPVCGSTLTEEHRKELLEEKKKKIAMLKVKISTLEKERQRVDEESEKNELVRNEVSEITAMMNAIETHDMAPIDKKLTRLLTIKADAEEKLTAILETYESKRKVFESLKRKLDKHNEMLKRTKEIDALKKKGAELKEQLQSIAFDESEMESIDNKHKELSFESNRVGYEIRTVIDKIRHCEETIKANKRKLEDAERMKQRCDRLKKLMEYLKIMKVCIAETQADIRRQLIDTINRTMEEVWPVIYPYKDYAKVRLVATKDDYVCQLQIPEMTDSRNNKDEDSGWITVIERASGGERAAVGLTMRIAFAMVLTPNLNWLILDEPTPNLDSECKEALAEALTERIPDIVEQTFVISHETEFLNHDFDSVYCFSRNKETKNEPTVYERVK